VASIDTALWTRLKNFAGLAYISSRIYPPPAPQNATYPLVIYSQVSGIRGYVYGNQDGFVRAGFQLDSYAQTAAAARALAEQVRLALSIYRGTSDGIVIDLITIENEQRVYEDDVLLHRIIQDYEVVYRETTPA
jgi:hypothetical protein